MKILLTLDYELFLGNKTGTSEHCLIKPMQAMIAHTAKYNVKFTLFVDAAYLYMLKKMGTEYSELLDEFKRVTEHLRYLQSLGHEIQMHLHPQWFYSSYTNGVWKLDQDHYKLSDMPHDEVERLFVSSKQVLDDIVGHKTIGFRAGGFSAQPTELLIELFQKTGLRIDSSVCAGTKYDSPKQKYDYSCCPQKSSYYFDKNICSEIDDIKSDDVKYLELPITMYRLSPLFYWKYIAIRMLRSSKHRNMGNGVSIAANNDSIRSRLLKHSLGMATIDGYKISYLVNVYKQQMINNAPLMCIIGHPKLATPYSIERLGSCCKYLSVSNATFVTLSECFN